MKNREKKEIVRFMSALLAALFLTAVVCSCGSGGVTPENPETEEYTYGIGLPTLPAVWNVQKTETEYAELICSGFACAVSDGHGNYYWKYEMASSVDDRTDGVTAEEKAKWNIADGETGRYWVISLNKDACWQDGTPITAADYISSMELLLSPEAKNPTAMKYISGDTALYNAGRCYGGEKAGDTLYAPYIVGYAEDGTPVVNPAMRGEKIYFNSSSKVFFFNDVFNAYFEKYGDKAEFAALSCYVGKGAVEVGDELKEKLNAVALLFGESNPDAWKEFCVCDVGTSVGVSFSDVGLFAKDDHTLVYVTEESVSKYELLFNTSTLWLVNTAAYTDDYCTSPETTVSYGPYKLVSVDGEKAVFERNDKWYGYSDGKHALEFQPDKVAFYALDGMDTAALTAYGAFDFAPYREGMTGLVLRAPETTVERLIFVTDRDVLLSLSAEAGENVNKVMLSYPSFRHALALSIDRNDLAEKSGDLAPAYGIFNELFLYDTESDVVTAYRNTAQAKSVIDNFYVTETWSDAERSEFIKKLYAEAYDAASEAGDVKDGDTVIINVAVGSSVTDTLRTRETLLNGYIEKAAQGTPFEGKIKLVFTASDDRYSAVEAGETEAALGAWEIPYNDVFSAIRCYTDSDYADPINEICGFDPASATVAVAADFGSGFETVMKSYTEWSRAINRGGEYYNAPTELKLTILSSLELNLLGECRFIVLASDADKYIRSVGFEQGSAAYNAVVGFGGVRTVKKLIPLTDFQE